MYENIAECNTMNYTKKKNNLLIGTIFPLKINICDRGRTITHLQISRFHTQVWYKYCYKMVLCWIIVGCIVAFFEMGQLI